MEDIQILKQLYYGNHLEPKELKQAESILRRLNIELQTRINPIKTKP